MKNRNLLLIIGGGIVILVCAGCLVLGVVGYLFYPLTQASVSEVEPIIGRWYVEENDLKMDIEFHENGTFKTRSAAGRFDPIVTRGDYTLNGAELTLETVEVTVVDSQGNERQPETEIPPDLVSLTYEIEILADKLIMTEKNSGQTLEYLKVD